MKKTLLCCVLALASSGVAAGVSREEAARLGQDLTPVGAEKAGNGRDIPAWTGGIPKDEAHKPGDFHADPFAADKPLFRITAANAEEHKARLTDGQREMLKRFPDMFFEVYPTRRSASYPQYVYDGIKTNATRAEVFKYGSGVKGATMSSPFPIPADGLEVLWNHTLRFRGLTDSYTAVASSVTAGGQRMDVLRQYEYFFKYSMRGAEPKDLDNKIFLLKRKTLAPANMAGAITLVHETLDQIRSPRKSWIYMPGQRRLRRTPDLAYDTADVNTNSIRTVDQVDMFNGAPDYYDWELKGKKEIYIPYNAYKVHQGDIELDDILHEHHINSELLRYEAHRVWVIEAKLRVGYSHRYSTRRYYVDEDSWSIVYAEEYDEDGELWEVTEAHLINYYEVPVVYTTLEVTYDLKDGRYYAEGLDNERGSTMNFSYDLSERDFSPSAVRREARR
ncbi:MAG: outer membrane lipoprotein-sorting protein [Oceanospirillaceae bacterium]|nr:outer membrane lipoprotein-sorting protein [Oceanospirillaceae bacterium]MBT13710.1 outer membrane lipoprotein-sorting protein [Oceanospirillaceae bacterium]|tara:strand:- start:4442 stop:5785 length:1344 start_codon:yes stop_codon:yes gene_type:complete